VSRGPVPPSAYENALTEMAAHMMKVQVSAKADAKASSSGSSDSDSSSTTQVATTGKPQLIFYKVSKGGEHARLSRKFEQVILFTQTPPKYNNANSYTRPDFRSGLAAKYFDIKVVDLSKEKSADVSLKQAPMIVVKNTAGDEVAKLTTGAIDSGRMYSTLLRVLKEDGLDQRKAIIKANTTLMKLYTVEIELQKLAKRTGRNIKKLTTEYKKLKAVGQAKLDEILTEI
jgi:hypothetical protein